MKTRTLLILFGLVLITGCATNVNLDYDKHTNFAALQTYKLHLPPELYTQDGRINSTLMQNRIINIIDYSMNQRGFTKTSDTPDFLVKYRIDLKQEIENNRSSATIGIGSFGRHFGSGIGFSVPLDNDIQSYDRGIIGIDIISNQTGKLIWRGSSSRRLSNGSTPESLDKFAFDVVSEILLEFPPGYKETLPIQ